MTDEHIAARDRKPARNNFFGHAALAILILGVVAFSRTFYLRAFFEPADLTARLGQTDLPLHIVVHGVSMTLWFALLCIQSWLVAWGRVALHRQLGILGVATAAIVVISALFTTVGFVPRVLEAGGGFAAFPGIVVRDLLSLIVFTLFVSLAVFWRKRPAVHKRFMLLASVVILGQALFRPPVSYLGQIIPDPFGLGLFFMANVVFVVTLATYDYLSDRRIHPVTMWAGAVVIFVELAVQLLLSVGAGEAAIGAMA